MTGLHIMDELLDALLFDPENTRRVPHLVSHEAPPALRFLCGCRAETPVYLAEVPPTAPTTVPSLEIVELTRHTNRTGYVWIGKCAHCGVLTYTTKRMRGDT